MAALAAALMFGAVAAPTLAQEPPVHPRFDSDRPAARVHPLPKADDVFHFVIFGDRTGGPRKGIEVLAQAVADTNLLAPDLVLTVGDLVEGYNDDAEWQEQADEYSRTMAGLRCPWFPVAGNHDLYYRGPDGTRTSHDRNFEAHFGPLWYAFEHKRCWFVALHSDEGDPATGERSFNKAAAQKMSEAQFTWLTRVLQRAAGAEHVFVFLHHPRWLKKYEKCDYGDDWNRVHALLAAAGNVTAVFAGHIHRVRYDGVRDGIEYFTLAAVGASLATDVPRAGYLHHVNLVTVRKERIDVATIPVGAMVDPRAVSATTSQDVARLADSFRARPVARIAFAPEGGMQAECALELRNPASRPIEVTALFTCGDPTFVARPDHLHLTVPPGEVKIATFALDRAARPLDSWFCWPAVDVRVDYLGEGVRVTLPAQLVKVDLDMAIAEPDVISDHACELDGAAACAAVAGRLDLPDGPFTVEGWLQGRDFAGRRGFVNNTESSGFGLFVSEGKPSFSVFLGEAYVTARTDAAALQVGGWHHLAGVFDGQEVRLYLDGKLVARKPGTGVRKDNRLPLCVGADPDGRGRPTSFFAGRVDEVRVSRGARYDGAEFTPVRRWSVDQDTALLLHFDRAVGPVTPDAGPQHLHAELVGPATFVPKASDSAR